MFIGKFKNDKPFPDKLAWNRGDQITYDQVSSVCVMIGLKSISGESCIIENQR